MKLPRFTLRELFLLVVVAAMGCGWWVNHQRQSERFERASGSFNTTVNALTDKLDSTSQQVRWLEEVMDKSDEHTKLGLKESESKLGGDVSQSPYSRSRETPLIAHVHEPVWAAADRPSFFTLRVKKQQNPCSSKGFGKDRRQLAITDKVEDRGLEPLSEIRPTWCGSIGCDSGNHPSAANALHGISPDCLQLALADADLRKVIGAWIALPIHVRQAIALLTESSSVR
jgi:hypothetical protein